MWFYLRNSSYDQGNKGSLGEKGFISFHNSIGIHLGFSHKNLVVLLHETILFVMHLTYLSALTTCNMWEKKENHEEKKKLRGRDRKMFFSMK